MPTAAEREAFMQMMGITSADVAAPEPKTGPSASRLGTSHHAASRPFGSHGGAKLSHPSGTESISSSVGLSISSVGSSMQPSSQRQSSDKRRAFLAELGIPEASLEEPRSGASTATSTPAVVDGGATASAGGRRSFSEASPRLSGSEPSSTLSSGLPPPLPRRALSHSGSAMQSTEDFKQAGNKAFEQGHFPKAIRAYTSAIDTLQAESAAAPQGRTMDGFLNGASTASTAVQLAALYSNRSAAYLQGAKLCDSLENAFEHALYDAEQAVALRGDWFKGYTRQGDVYFKMQRYEQAADAFQMALHLEPGNSNIANSLEESRERARLACRRGRGGGRTGEASLGQTSPSVPTTAFSAGSTGGERDDSRETSATPVRTAAHGSPSSARTAYGLYDHGLPRTTQGGHVPPPSMPPMSSSAAVDAGSAATYTSGARVPLARKSSFDAYYDGTHGDVRQDWQRLKREVEDTTNDPTGDDYRRREIEKYRTQRSTGQRTESRSFAALRATYQSNPLVSSNGSPRSDASGELRGHSATSSSTAEAGSGGVRRTPQFTTSARAPSDRRLSVESDGEKHLNNIDIPSQFSSEAAMTYQQKLLEEYRRRKEKNGE